MNDGGQWAFALDDQWFVVAMTDEQAVVAGDSLVLGAFQYGPEAVDRVLQGSAGVNSVEEIRSVLRHLGGWMLADVSDGDALRERLHPAMRDVLDELEATDTFVTSWISPTVHFGAKIGLHYFGFRVHDSTGRLAGSVVVSKPTAPMTTMAMLTASADLDHLERMRGLARAARRPAAVLFADLEGSTQLSKRLPTSTFFKLIRRITRAADACVIEAGGLVGRHAGDGVAAFFVAETFGSESTAARACIAAAKALQTSMAQIAERHDLAASDVTVRAGLHWGATLHIGSIVTTGRTEVTALGDAVNEAARIEACASGGRMLASKDLIERLDLADAALLGVDPERISYTQLADLETATEKARRDAPAIPVCDVLRRAETERDVRATRKCQVRGDGSSPSTRTPTALTKNSNSAAAVLGRVEWLPYPCIARPRRFRGMMVETAGGAMSRLGVAGLRAESASVVQIAQSLTADEWNAPSDCAGWSVRDVVAHMASIMHGVVDPSWMPDLSSGTEDAMEVPVEARRTWTNEEVLAEFDAFSGQLADLGETLQEPPVSETLLPMNELGIHPMSLLPSSFLFDTYCHLRNDILAPNGPNDRPVPPRDEMRLLPTVQWMLAGLPWMCTEQLAFVDRPIEFVLSGIGGGTWWIGPGGEADRVLVSEVPLEGAVANVESDAHDFVLWGTRRRPWVQFATVTGDNAYAGRVLDAFHII